MKSYVVAVTVVLATLALAGSAQAQGEYNQGGSRAPDGPWFGGGLNMSAGDGPDGPGIRLEFGIPLKVVGPGQFSLALPMSTYHDSLPGDARINVINFVPEVQWEYVFPLREFEHRFSISPVFGFGFGGIWAGGSNIDNDGAFMLTNRLGAVVRLGFTNGLILAMQPFAVTLNGAFNYDHDDFFANYEWYFVAGYRWD